MIEKIRPLAAGIRPGGFFVDRIDANAEHLTLNI
jgi:hypothetical protein